YEEAVTYLEAANRLIEEENPDNSHAGPVLEQLGDLMYMTGLDRARGIEYLHRALALYEQSGDPRIVLVHSRLGRAYSTFPATMNIPLAFEHYNAARDIVRDFPDSVPLGYLQTGIASAGLFGDRTDVGLAAAERAVAIAEAAGDDGLRANALSMNGWFLAATNRCAEGWRMLDESWRLADRIGHVMAGYFAAWQLAALGFFAWDVRRGQAGAQREIDSGRLAQIPEWGNFLVCTSVDQQLALGDDGPAREFFAEHPDQDLYPNVLKWRLLLLDGEWEAAAEWADRQTRQWAAAGIDLLVSGYQAGTAMCLELLGDVDGAVRAADEQLLSIEGGPSIINTGFFAWFRARLHLDRHELDLAQQVVDRIRAELAIAEWGGLGGRLDELQAEILLARGDLAAAQPFYASARASSAAFPYVMFDAEFQYRWATAMQRAGHPDRAAGHFAEAIATYQRYGFAQRWIKRVDDAAATPAR
ncbi:MAG: hypothetical protein QOI15_831, partial [Pseudonocardiales bacterium]|nr:hypothetical protein [Pseudonocardiales bacterium]